MVRRYVAGRRYVDDDSWGVLDRETGEFVTDPETGEDLVFEKWQDAQLAANRHETEEVHGD